MAAGGTRFRQMNNRLRWSSMQDGGGTHLDGFPLFSAYFASTAQLLPNGDKGASVQQALGVPSNSTKQRTDQPANAVCSGSSGVCRCGVLRHFEYAHQPLAVFVG